MTESDYSQTIFILTGYIKGAQVKQTVKGRHVVGVVVTPEPTDIKLVEGAWSYAVQHTPKTLNEADFDRARNLLQKRYPSWQIFADNSVVQFVRHDPSFIENDKPEVDAQE